MMETTTDSENTTWAPLGRTDEDPSELGPTNEALARTKLLGRQLTECRERRDELLAYLQSCRKLSGERLHDIANLVTERKELREQLADWKATAEELASGAGADVLRRQLDECQQALAAAEAQGLRGEHPCWGCQDVLKGRDACSGCYKLKEAREWENSTAALDAALEAADRQWDKTSLSEIVEERNELRDELAAAQAANSRLRQYVGHKSDCPRAAPPYGDCQCGYLDLMKLLHYGDRAALDAALEARTIEVLTEVAERITSGKWDGKPVPATVFAARESVHRALDAALGQARAAARADAERLLSLMECGHPLAVWEEDDDGERYCAWCRTLEQAREGSRLEGDSKRRHIDTCTYCSLLPDAPKYCRYCGRPMDNQNEPRYSRLAEQARAEGAAEALDQAAYRVDEAEASSLSGWDNEAYAAWLNFNQRLDARIRRTVDKARCEERERCARIVEDAICCDFDRDGVIASFFEMYGWYDLREIARAIREEADDVP